MRPRVFPAEDSAHPCYPALRPPCFNEAAGIPRGRLRVGRNHHQACSASMRPRVFPAEDPDGTDGTDAREVASMRPRVFPAEDSCTTRPTTTGTAASMRPRVFPAEDFLRGDDGRSRFFHALQ